ncbi:hypothetical protein CTI12_AA048600 [Artemisia annua]|uniref:DUF4283 domain-containing protein n=1 Tax=Artemisia annua TaxID=35608 RepID=A0A2U1QC99_ARTAN|nr:hypothetical protein CTI12_AA048600 [Artemisia annua]
MPIDNNKPPDPLIQEFCELTRMSSANMRHTVVDVSSSRGKEGKPQRHRHGIKIKVSTPGSASIGAGSVEKPSFIFSSANSSTSKHVDSHDKAYGNDGSFIKLPLDKNPLDSNQKVPVTKSSGLEPGFDHSGMDDVVNASCGQASSRDGIAIAKTGNSVDLAGSNQSSEHTHMEGVVKMGVVPTSDLNGITSDKGSGDFEFGKNDKAKDILKKPIGPFFKVQFGVNSLDNPFVKKNVNNIGNNWNSNDVRGFGSTMLSNQFTADVDRFAEKLKQGSEDLALKMEYTPNVVSKMDNGNRRIQFSTEEVYKGGQSCALQLYGYFIGTSMDYRVVRGNLMKMRRVYGIEDITKTSSSISYFKFKSEEGMKTVLDCGPWMVQNVPLVLNTWEPGIWLEKTEPSSIPIWANR